MLEPYDSTIHNSWITLFNLATNSSAMGVVNRIEYEGMHAKNTTGQDITWTKSKSKNLVMGTIITGKPIENSNMSMRWSYLVSELKPIFWCKQLKGVQNLSSICDHHHFVWMVDGIHLLHIHGNQFLPSFCIDPSSYQGPTQSEKFHASLLHQIHIHRNKEALIWCLLAFHPSFTKWKLACIIAASGSYS